VLIVVSAIVVAATAAAVALLRTACAVALLRTACAVALRRAQGDGKMIVGSGSVALEAKPLVLRQAQDDIIKAANPRIILSLSTNRVMRSLSTNRVILSLSKDVVLATLSLAKGGQSRARGCDGGHPRACSCGAC